MKIDPDVTADISEFSRKTDEVKSVINRLDKTNADTEITADIDKAVRNIKVYKDL